MIGRTNLSRTLLVSRPRRALSSAVAAAALATTLLAVTAAPTLAYGNNGPSATLGGYGVTVGASVGCDPRSATMTVSASATTMQASGMLGPTVGPYDAGQWIRYNVFSRELGAASWTQVYNWSNWQWIVSTSGNGDVQIVSPVDLGTNNLVTGTPGHNYEVLVQIDYWTGVENVINVTPSYSQTLSLSGIDFSLQPGYCHL
jgi:hypothetical protein